MTFRFGGLEVYFIKRYKYHIYRSTTSVDQTSDECNFGLISLPRLTSKLLGKFDSSKTNLFDYNYGVTCTEFDEYMS